MQNYLCLVAQKHMESSNCIYKQHRAIIQEKQYGNKKILCEFSYYFPESAPLFTI